ncbi:glycerol uptake facilitator protein [Entomoplasma freundtii]|uniref:Glycerol uptake facilitator protein n=1 Tax=Entomoplasma freundtii TaxID=74700 RepID=A0A2K8NQI6_9MOLU|nr:MIP/aquaporin family protein [Entomoplasma freundtii]ATZ16047.1 glycerol uptake facilitator protein [Entomoplasma freundtii]TDY58084.1 glycerol uptake facilitator protein [Entomoplasma freundtii]
MSNWFTYFGTELLGSMLLIILGNGVVANVLLKGTSAYKNANFLMIALGWGFAVGIGALVASALGGVAQLNPAVTLAFVVNNWTKNVGSWNLLPIIIIGQALGFLLGQIIVDLVYSHQIVACFARAKKDFATENTQPVLAMHATVPQTKVTWSNFLMEFVGTAVLIITILGVGKLGIANGMTFVTPLLVMIVVMAIGCSLSGTTGYAINPFRDLMPRLVYQGLLSTSFGRKGLNADWKYSWVPVVAPLTAGAIVGACFLI